MHKLVDTITAISTPIGDGGIGIVRMSGPDSIAIAERIFERGDRREFNPVESHKMVYGFIKDPDSDKVVDEVMLTVMLAPNTFTKENMVEINCHGGLYVTRKVLDTTLLAGARLAERGEFTRRAFLNGRISLAQAEGVIDLIDAKSEASYKAALKELNNSLSEKITTIKDRLSKIAAETEAEIDFSEDDLEGSDHSVWIKEISDILTEINNLIGSYDHGKILRDGLTVSIVGRPNTGKSSLMNRLLNYDRAIVSDIPGTTRDTIEEKLSVNGIAVQLIDTAGVQESQNILEAEGIRRSREKIEQSDILIFLFDGSYDLTSYDLDLALMVRRLGKKVVWVINKSDIKGKFRENKIREITGERPIMISAKRGDGIESLLSALSDTIWEGGCGKSEDIIITRRRHFDLLTKGKIPLERGIKTLKRDNNAVELFAVDIREAIMALGEINGDQYTDSLLDKIFNDFCIGK
ncbi:MAG: tRNA uridine-5-carboxymethylaminomethyl(34) synthesis GTPase MnmE [Nitrospinota bacterium]